MGLVLGKVCGLITKILSTSWASKKKIQRSQHHLDEGLITIQNDSHVILIPRQELIRTSPTNSCSNYGMIEEKEVIHAVTITNVVVTKENEVGVVDVHISKEGIIEDNELGVSLVQPDHHIAKDDIISKCQYDSASSSNAPPEVVRKIGKTIRHYSSLHKILLVGEGDFSFSASLGKAFGAATNIVATSLDDLDFLKKNYPRATTNIGYLRNSGGVVIHKVDATKLADHDLLYVSKFDRIIYNFPLAGFFNESKKMSLKRNRKLVRMFMMNAKELLDMGGEIHITHKTSSSPREWNVENVAKKCHLQLIEDVEFKLHHYPGYQTKYGFGGNENFNCYPSRTYKFGLKTLADKLSNVDSPVTDHRLVLPLIAGLPEHYGPIASFIQQTEHLPPFYKDRSMLTPEETRRNEVASSNPTALVATPQVDIVVEEQPPTNNAHRCRGGRRRGRNNNAQQQQSQQLQWSPQPAYQYPRGPWAPNWAVPPSPYPTAPWYRPVYPRSDCSAGVLGSRPQAYATSLAPSTVASYPMVIDSAMHIMTQQHPNPNWYMDTDATSHMASSSGYENGTTSYEM